MRSGTVINKRFLKGKNLTTDELEWLNEQYEHAIFFLDMIGDPSFKLVVDELHRRTSRIYGYIDNRS